MKISRSEFTNRSAVESKFLPDSFDLNTLKTSGWYSPLGGVNSGPDNFQLYHLFVIAPNPDVYATQLAFGTTYKVFTPSAIEGDEPIVEDEIIRDRNGNIVYTNKRFAADITNDNIPDTDPGDFYVMADNGEKYDSARIVTNDVIADGIHPLEDTSSDNSSNNSENDIVEDVPNITILNRSAIFTRSYFHGTWTSWVTWTGSSSSGDSSASSGNNIDTDKIYSYIDNRIHFESYVSGISSYGMKCEITGTYNTAPYDPNADVYEVEPLGIEYDAFDDLPPIGDPQKLYVVKSENKIYRYDEATHMFYCVGSDYNELTHIISGYSSQN